MYTFTDIIITHKKLWHKTFFFNWSKFARVAGPLSHLWVNDTPEYAMHTSHAVNNQSVNSVGHSIKCNVKSMAGTILLYQSTH